MKLDKLENFYRGWVCGFFDPSLYKTNIEVGIQKYSEGQTHEAHFHKLSDEINIILEGECIFRFIKENYIDDVSLSVDDILVVEKNEVVEFHATTNCKLLVIKTQSIPNDKYLY